MAASNKLSMGKLKKKKMKHMNVDEFLNADMDSDSESSLKSSDSSSQKEPNGKIKSTMKTVKNANAIIQKSKQNPKPKKNHVSAVTLTPKDSQSKTVNDNKINIKSQKKRKEMKQVKMVKPSLAKTLEDNDPEFFEYLKGEDENLLKNLEDLSDESDTSTSDGEGNNETSDMMNDNDSSKALKKKKSDLLNMSSGDEEEDDSDSNEGRSTTLTLHKLPSKLEVASDDSEAESEEEQNSQHTPSDGKILITNKLLEQWLEQIQQRPSPKLFKKIVSAFHGAVFEAGGEKQDLVSSKYKVQGSSIFNGIVRLCLLYITPALQKILRITDLSGSEPLNKSKNWNKVKADVKSYIGALLQLLGQLSEAAMINAILKHIHKLVLLYVTFPNKSKAMMKQMIKMWTTGEETSRVLAFLCINKLIHLKQDQFLETCVKKMYMAYVSNCKFVSPTSLPLINFMQRSFVEILSNDFLMTYQFAFVYIRQLAIHLRNAISVKKKNMFQVVYNWQYVHCLGLWVQLLSSHPNDTLKPLIYPLTQTIIGTIKLVPTARYYPLRFHCVRMLNTLASKTNIFIPTLPFLLEVFEQTDFNKRHKSVSLKPFNFSILLKFSKGQLAEKAFKDGLIDQLYEHLLESYNIYAHSVGFPELIVPSLVQLKDFNKKCKIANYCKQIKQIIEKIEEQSNFMVERRKRSSLRLDDLTGVHQWEQKIDISPLKKFYISWRKLRDRELQHDIASKEAISGAAIDIPSITYKKEKRATPEERESLSKLFEDDSESDNETRFLMKEERPKEKGKKRKRGDDDDESDGDDYSDFNEEELEQLAQSASEGEDSDDDVEKGDVIEEDDSIEEINSEEDMEFEDDDEKEDEEEGTVAAKPSKKKKTATKSKAVKSKEELNDDADGEDDIVEDFDLSSF